MDRRFVLELRGAVSLGRRPGEDLPAPGLERGGHGAVQDGILAERRVKDVRAERRQLVELSSDGLDQEVAAPADAASEDAGLWIEDGADRGDAEGQAPVLLLDGTVG